MLSGLHGDNSIVVTESLLGVKTCVYINCTDVTFIDVMVYEALQDIGASRSRATNATMSRTDGRLARGNQHRSMKSQCDGAICDSLGSSGFLPLMTCHNTALSFFTL